MAAAAAKANTKQGDDKQKGAEDDKEEGGEGGKGRDGGATGGDSAEAAVEKARQESAEALLAASEKAEQAREGAKKAKTLYHKLKLVSDGALFVNCRCRVLAFDLTRNLLFYFCSCRALVSKRPISIVVGPVRSPFAVVTRTKLY